MRSMFLLLTLILVMGGFLAKGYAEVSGVSSSIAENDEDFNDIQLTNINTATKEELLLVQGIGPVLAERILAYREEHGPFRQTEDLRSVNGIGEAKYEKIKTQVNV